MDFSFCYECCHVNSVECVEHSILDAIALFIPTFLISHVLYSDDDNNNNSNNTALKKVKEYWLYRILFF